MVPPMRLRAWTVGGVVAVALLSPVVAAAADDVVGYPRCGVDGTAADYTWFVNDSHHAITVSPQLDYQGTSYSAEPIDCAAAVSCVTARPEMAGRAATIAGRNPLVGTNGPDYLIGSAGADRIVGRKGADTLCGGVGNDVLLGGLGNDLLIGGSGHDELRGGHDHDIVDGGVGRDALFGGPGADVLRGRLGRDSLYGAEGEDLLRGGPGRDVCFGGDGPDAFLYCAVEAEDDVIYGSGPVHTLRVQIDPLLDESAALFTAYVDWILSDPRSWIGGDEATWHRVGAEAEADLTIILAAPETVDAICFPLITGGYFSCRNGDTIGINVNRWNTATDWWPASLHVYRTYVINHEVGHYLGHGHTTCPGNGLPADVMQQQTKTLGGCVANGWVYP